MANSNWVRSKRERLMSVQGQNCFYCGVEMLTDKCHIRSPRYATLERVEPGSRGGKYVKGNTVVACRSCNNHKSSMDIEEFVVWLFEDGLSTSKLRQRRKQACQPTA